MERPGWYVDFVASSAAIGGVLWLIARPRSTTVWLGVVRPDGDPVVVIDDDTPPLPTVGAELRAPGLWLDLVTEEPETRWSLGVEAFGVTVEADAPPVVEPGGERTPLGLDLEWEAVGTLGAGEVGCAVHGEVLVGRDAVELEGHGVVRTAASVTAWGWSRLRDGSWRSGASTSADGSGGRLPFASAGPDGRAGAAVAELTHSAAGTGWTISTVR